MADFLIRPTAGSVETFEFLTDVQIALSGKESRIAKRAAPRLSYTQNYAFTADLASEDYELFLSARTAATVRIPLAPHVIDRPYFPASYATDFNGQTTAGVGLTHVLWNPDGSYTTVPFSLSNLNANTTWYQACPVVEAVPDLSANYTVRSAKTVQAQLRFQLKDFVEKMPTAPWFTKAGVLTDAGTWDFFNNRNTAETTLSTTDAIDVLDTGNRVYVNSVKRFSKNKVSVALTLTSREEIMKFRNFLYVVQGMCNPFLFKHSEFDADVGQLARLGSDTIEISYLRPDIATVNLDLVLVEA